MKKLLVLVGTRPEAIKLIPLYLELRKVKGWDILLVSTGQHKEMLNSIFGLFSVQPDHDLQVMTQNQGLDQLSSKLLDKCGELFKRVRPDLVIVQGDTTSAMVGALTAFYQKIRIAHVEAGLRSYDIQSPFPEEVNRRFISIVTDFHFTPTLYSAAALRKEHVNGTVYVVGNTVIDALMLTRKAIKGKEKIFRQTYQQVLNGFKQMVLITGHRRESFGQGFQDICYAIHQLAARYTDTAFAYPVHLNPRVRGPVFELLTGLRNVFLIEPVPYDHMVFLMDACKLILTDSGGIQEEAPSLGKPVVVMRDTTERPEGVKAGCVVLAGTSTARIVKVASHLLDNKSAYSKMSRKKMPYGKGDTSKKIVRVLKSEL